MQSSLQAVVQSSLPSSLQSSEIHVQSSVYYLCAIFAIACSILAFACGVARVVIMAFRMKATRAPVLKLKHALESWCDLDACYDLVKKLQPVKEGWGHRGLPPSQEVVDFLPLALLLVDVSSTFKFLQKDVVAAMMEMQGSHHSCLGTCPVANSRACAWLVRQNLVRQYREMAGDDKSKAIVFREVLMLS